MFVNHAKILEKKCVSLNKSVERAKEDEIEYETEFLDHVKSNYSFSEQKYFRELSRKKNWNLPLSKLNNHKISGVKGSFLKQLKGRIEIRKPRKPKAFSVSPEELYTQPTADKRIQVLLKSRANFNQHSVIPKKYDGSVYFVHQIGRKFTGIKGSGNSLSSSEISPISERIKKSKDFQHKVKTQFTPLIDSKKALDLRLRADYYPNKKHQFIRDIPRFKLFKSGFNHLT